MRVYGPDWHTLKSIRTKCEICSSEHQQFYARQHVPLLLDFCRILLVSHVRSPSSCLHLGARAQRWLLAPSTTLLLLCLIAIAAVVSSSWSSCAMCALCSSALASASVLYSMLPVQLLQHLCTLPMYTHMTCLIEWAREEGTHTICSMKFLCRKTPSVFVCFSWWGDRFFVAIISCDILTYFPLCFFFQSSGNKLVGRDGNWRS